MLARMQFDNFAQLIYLINWEVINLSGDKTGNYFRFTVILRDQSINLLCKTAGHSVHVNVRQVKVVGLYKFTLPALYVL